MAINSLKLNQKVKLRSERA